MPEALQVRSYLPGDEVGIQALFARCFGVARSDAEWRWRFADSPTGLASILVVLDGDEVVGHLAFNMYDGTVHGSPARIALGGDMMVHPGHRRRGIGQRMVDHQPALMAPHDLRVSFPVEAVTQMKRPGSEQAVLSDLPVWVRARSAEAIASLRGGAAGRVAASAGLHVWGAVATAAATSARVRVEPVSTIAALGDEIDVLATEATSWAAVTRVRHAAYLRWRWFDRPGASWRTLVARRAGRLTGLVVVDVAADADGRGRIVDVLATDGRTLTALMVAAARRLELEGAELVEVLYADPRRWARAAMWVAGFAPRGTGPNLLATFDTGRFPTDTCHDLSHWYLTYGDTDLV